MEYLSCSPLLLLICLTLASTMEAQTGAEQVASANPPVSRVLSLAEAKKTAFQRNWDLLAAKNGMNVAAAQLIVAREFPNPTLSLSTARIDAHGVGNSTPSGNGLWNRSYDTIAAISQLVEIGGKRADRRASARAGIAGARARFFDARRFLNQGVTKAYVAALLAENNVQILNDSARSLRHEADIATARFKAGDISDADKKQIENNADVFELQAKSAAAAAVEARIEVEILMGLDQPKGDWKPADSLEQLAGAVPQQNKPAFGGARPDVLAAEADLRKSKVDVKLQKTIRIPDPTFSVQVEHNPPGPPGPETVGIGVSFPLPIWNRNGGAIKAAEAAASQSAFALAKVKAQVLSDIANAEVGYQEASERFQRYQNQIRPKSGKVRESVAFAFEKGGASLVDLLTAERDDNGIRLATAQAMSDTASAAADLEAARNVLSETELNSQK
jgi:cobalt-zinc-cadmium efflux system outer membrane protein